MKIADIEWRGYWPAAPTPFAKDHSVDEEALRNLMQLYLAQGVHGILINGTTGEWFSQSLDERRRVAEIAVDEVGNKVPVVVGCTAYTPTEVIDLADHAREMGAAGALATPPPYVHPSQEEIFLFYKEITESVEMPWMAYNWPRGTAVDISVETASLIADLTNVVAIKDSTGDELKCMQTVEAVADRVRVFGRFIHPRGMAFMRGLAGDGNIDGGAIGAPFAVPFYEAIFTNDIETAHFFSRKYDALVQNLVHSDYSSRFASPTSQLKAAMSILGQPGGIVRRPLQPIAEHEIPRLRAALTASGLI